MRETPRLDRTRTRLCLTVGAALTLDALLHELARLARQQHARIRLEVGDAHAFERDLRKALRGLLRIERLHCDSPLFQQRERLGCELVVVFKHVEDARSQKDRTLPAGFGVTPQFRRADHEVDINRVAVVERSNEPRLVARARSRVPRTPGVDERHTCALAE